MTADRKVYVRDLLEVCNLCFRSPDLLDKYWPTGDSDLIPALQMSSWVISGVLYELMRCERTEAERETVDGWRPRLKRRHQLIVISQPDDLDCGIPHLVRR